MTETRYSHDQKEKAFEILSKQFPIKEDSYKQFIESGCLNFKCDFLDILKNLYGPYMPQLSNNEIKHPLDIEYFNDFKAPIMELIHSPHFTNLNSTIPYFGPMMYFLVRQFGCEQVLEIGIAQGYTSWYLCHGVKDNMTRFNMQGNMYYGVDIIDRSEAVKPHLDAANLPNTILQMDSIDITPDTFKEVRFDMIFQDGGHDTEHVVHEFKTLWPQLKPDCYWLAHDTMGPAEEGCRELRRMIKEKSIPVEYIQLGGMYGLMIIRKLEGVDPEKRYWVE